MKLKVNHSNIDYTQKMDDFTNDPIEFDFNESDLFIGFHKKIKEIYIELEARSDESEISVSAWDGSSWVIINDLEDATFGLTQSGSVKWPEPTPNYKQNLDGSGEKFWVKLSFVSLPTLVGINGINITLSSDKDLSFVPNIFDFLPEASSSFIAFHQEARNMIVQMLRNSGKKISTYDNYLNNNLIIETRQVDQFDLLNVEEFRNASKYLALHLIFDFISKSNDDVFFQRSVRFYERFLESYNSNFVSIDGNNNGITDQGENLAVQFIGIVRE